MILLFKKVIHFYYLKNLFFLYSFNEEKINDGWIPFSAGKHRLGQSHSQNLNFRRYFSDTKCCEDPNEDLDKLYKLFLLTE